MVMIQKTINWIELISMFYSAGGALGSLSENLKSLSQKGAMQGAVLTPPIAVGSKVHHVITERNLWASQRANIWCGGPSWAL